jgi:hypothetical protein
VVSPARGPLGGPRLATFEFACGAAIFEAPRAAVPADDFLFAPRIAGDLRLAPWRLSCPDMGRLSYEAPWGDPRRESATASKIAQSEAMC